MSVAELIGDDVAEPALKLGLLSWAKQATIQRSGDFLEDLLDRSAASAPP